MFMLTNVFLITYSCSYIIKLCVLCVCCICVVCSCVMHCVCLCAFVKPGALHTWFLKIDPVQIVSMSACVFVSMPEAINN